MRPEHKSMRAIFSSMGKICDILYDVLSQKGEMLHFQAFIVIFWHFITIYVSLWYFMVLLCTLWHFRPVTLIFGEITFVAIYAIILVQPLLV